MSNKKQKYNNYNNHNNKKEHNEIQKNNNYDNNTDDEYDDEESKGGVFKFGLIILIIVIILIGFMYKDLIIDSLSNISNNISISKNDDDKNNKNNKNSEDNKKHIESDESLYFYFYENSSYADDFNNVECFLEKENDTNYKYLGEYLVKYEDGICYSVCGDFALIYDEDLMIYNYKTKEEYKLDKDILLDGYKLSDCYLTLVANEEIGGVIINYKNKYKNYYSYNDNEIVLSKMSNTTFKIYDGFMVYYINNDSNMSNMHVVSYDGKDFIPSKNNLTKYYDTDFYYFSFNIDDSTYYNFYNKNRELIIENVYVNKENRYQVKSDDEKNIIVSTNGIFYEYDLKGNKVHTSKKYSDLIFASDNNLNTNINIVVDGKVLKLIDNKEFSLLQLNENFNGKILDVNSTQNKIEIITLDNSVSIENIIANSNFAGYTKEEINSKYKNNIGCKYIYDIKTGEVIKEFGLYSLQEDLEKESDELK